MILAYFIISFIKNIEIIIIEITKGIPKRLYLIESIKLKFNNALIERVKPHPGQAKCKYFFIGQSHENSKT